MLLDIDFPECSPFHPVFSFKQTMSMLAYLAQVIHVSLHTRIYYLLWPITYDNNYDFTFCTTLYGKSNP